MRAKILIKLENLQIEPEIEKIACSEDAKNPNKLETKIISLSTRREEKLRGTIYKIKWSKFEAAERKMYYRILKILIKTIIIINLFDTYIAA